MRRRFFNSGGNVEPPKAATFVARDVTNVLKESMTLGIQGVSQPIGIVIMWDKEYEAFRAFAFNDDYLPYMYHQEEAKEYLVDDFIPAGVLLYGRRQSDVLGTNLEEITCISLLMPSNSGEVYNLITQERARVAAKRLISEVPTYSGISYLSQKIDTLKASSCMIPTSFNYITTLASNNPLAGYNIFHETDFHFHFPYIEQADNIVLSEMDRFEDWIYSGNIVGANMEIQHSAASSFVTLNDNFEAYLCPSLNQDVDMYKGGVTSPIDIATDMPQCRLQDNAQPTTYLRNMVKGWVSKFNGLGRIQLPTFFELRMLFSRLGLISIIQEELKSQGLITTSIVDLLGTSGFGNVLFGMTSYNSTGIPKMGLQGISGRLFNLPAYPTKVDAYCIPFFSLSIEDLV